MQAYTVEGFMTKDIVAVEPSCSIPDALEQLHAKHISCVVVCEKNAPIGIVTEQDVVKISLSQMSGNGRQPKTVGEAMTSPIMTIHAQESIESATAIAREHKIRHLPVLNILGRLVGVLTQTDMINAQTTLLEERLSQVQAVPTVPIPQ